MTNPEWAYLYQERLGIMMDSELEPTREQKEMAMRWADEDFARL